MDIAHVERVRSELRKVGVTRYGLLKGESRKLPQIIHPEEHIHAAVYGRCEDGSAMLVATDRRVIYLDWKPLYVTSDEISYDVVAGVTYGHQSVVATITLHSRIGDYTMRYTNINCARKFVDYIEKRRLEQTQKNGKEPGKLKSSTSGVTALDADVIAFLQNHELATLSTLDRTGNVHGASVYYRLANGYIYLITKELTHKAHNILVHSRVALTITDEPSMKTLQLEGAAELEVDLDVRQQIFDSIVRERTYDTGKTMPPVTMLQAGGFIVLRIEPLHVTLSDFHHTIFRI